MATTEYLLKKEVDRVLAALTPVNRLIVRTMLETGLRIGDVLNLQYWQIRTNFWITEQKTGKRRHIGMTQQLIDDIRAAADEVIPPNVRKYAGSEYRKDAPIAWAFPSPRDWRKHRTRQGVWKDIKRAATAFRIPVNAGAHSMRKVYAVELLKKYGDMEKVKRALNHSDMTVTLIYAMADRLVEAGHLARVCKNGKRL